MESKTAEEGNIFDMLETVAGKSSLNQQQRQEYEESEKRYYDNLNLLRKARETAFAEGWQSAVYGCEADGQNELGEGCRQILERLKAEYKDSAFRQLANVAKTRKLTEREQMTYDSSLKHYRDTMNIVWGVMMEGRAEGKRQASAARETQSETNRRL